jgi:hypothetical protein
VRGWGRGSTFVISTTQCSSLAGFLSRWSRKMLPRPRIDWLPHDED